MFQNDYVGQHPSRTTTWWLLAGGQLVQVPLLNPPRPPREAVGYKIEFLDPPHARIEWRRIRGADLASGSPLAEHVAEAVRSLRWTPERAAEALRLAAESPTDAEAIRRAEIWAVRAAL